MKLYHSLKNSQVKTRQKLTYVPEQLYHSLKNSQVKTLLYQ